jgi:hypothetical protein
MARSSESDRPALNSTQRHGPADRSSPGRIAHGWHRTHKPDCPPVTVSPVALRTRNRLMHDGLSFTKQEAIGRHQVQARRVTERYIALSAAEQALVLDFLRGLAGRRRRETAYNQRRTRRL